MPWRNRPAPLPLRTLTVSSFFPAGWPAKPRPNSPQPPDDGPRASRPAHGWERARDLVRHRCAEKGRGRQHTQNRTAGVQAAPALDQGTGLRAGAEGIGGLELSVDRLDDEQGIGPRREQEEGADQPARIAALPPPGGQAERKARQRET